MTTALTPAPGSPPAVTPYSDKEIKYRGKSKAASTITDYRRRFAEFQHFAAQRGAVSLPASVDLVIDYITELAEHHQKVSTIEKKLAAIAFVHRELEHADPTVHIRVRDTMAGIRRALGVAAHKKEPAKLDPLRKMIAALPDTLAGQRDRALLLIGFAGAFRRSELTAIDVGDTHVNGKLTITIKRSKTDQEGKGLVKVIPPIDDETIDPMTALHDWLEASNIQSGPIFRQIDRWGHVRADRLTPQSVARIVKGAAKRAGLEPRQFAGHSLRSGFITEAADAGIESRDIMALTGHKSERVMREYIQDAGLGAMRAVKGAFGERIGAAAGKSPRKNRR